MLPLFFISFICLVLNSGYVQTSVVRTNNGPVVQTPVGTIRGVRSENDDYNMFLGIPYAKVNASNPFGRSVPEPPFNDIFDANDDTAICPQIEEFNNTFVGTLDCLHIHVYVPDSASAQNRLPVMVNIYGGGFRIGFAGRFLYGPEYLIRHDVILVTLNYRLGPYGFMCLDIPEVPGNQGLHDQVIALRWIKNNIEAFGGDPNKITVFGNSAGGMSIGLHLVSETELLFNNGIQQSGPAFMSSVVGKSDPHIPIELAPMFGLFTDDVYEALDHLSKQNPHEVVGAAFLFNVNFGPCIEKKFPGVVRYLSENPINSDHSKAANVNMMVGYNSHELLLLYPYAENSNTFLSWSRRFRESLQSAFNFSNSLLDENEGIVRRFYIGDDDINNNVRHKMMDFSSDVSFVYPTIRSIEYYLNAGASKVYQYMFSYDGKRNFVKIRTGVDEPGAAHADELGYLFKMNFIPDTPNAADQLIIDRMTAMWANFAKFNDPTPTVNTLLPVKWEAITKDSPYHYINIDTEMTAGSRFEHRRMTFWDLFYNSYAEYERGFGETDLEEDGETDESTTPTPTTEVTTPTTEVTTPTTEVTTPTTEVTTTTEAPGSANTLYFTHLMLVTLIVTFYV